MKGTDILGIQVSFSDSKLLFVLSTLDPTQIFLTYFTKTCLHNKNQFLHLSKYFTIVGLGLC